MTETSYPYNHIPCQNEFTHGGIIYNMYTCPEVLDRALQFEFKSTDIVVCTFPRSGTTLTQETIWQIKHCDTIVKGKKYPDLDIRFPFLELDTPTVNPNVPHCIEALEKDANSSPYRLIKTHLPPRQIGPKLLASGAKLVVVFRNPKDVAVSMYHFYRGLDIHGPWPGGWEDFLAIFTHEKTFSGGWFENCLEWWALRHLDNLLMLRYEDMLREPHQTVRKLSAFLGVTTITPEQVDTVVHNTSFKSMANNELVNCIFPTGFSFIRKGGIGDWKNHFTVNQNIAMNQLIEEKLAGTDFFCQFD